MTLTAKWQEAKGLMEETVERRAVAALAASLALPALDTESAARFAETEGLVTHLTSLVLVDESRGRSGWHSGDTKGCASSASPECDGIDG